MIYMYRASTSSLLPLKNMRFVLSGKMNKEKYQGKIEALGGKVKNSVDKDTIALVSDKGKEEMKADGFDELTKFKNFQ